MPVSRSFNDTLSAAVNDIAEHGFDSEGRIKFWTDEIRKAAEKEMKSEADMDNALRRALHSIYSRMVDKGDIVRFHAGVSRFTLQKVKPQLRAELDRRIMASANLIKLHRKGAIDKTLQRFQGWSTSIPAGGTKSGKKDAKDNIKKALGSLPFEDRRVLIDQGHKLTAAISETLAKGGQAIACEWHSHWRQANYDYREDHKERDKQVYLLKGNWAQEKGLVKPSDAGYYENITSVGEEPFCFPGDSEVPFADGVVKGYRRFYTGELIELETSSGSKVRATPNHPVLTSSGWRAIGLLNVGDDVIEVAHKDWRLAKENGNQRVPTISEIFSTLQEDGIMQTANQRPAGFHGDGSKGYVDIVLAARSLLIDFVTKRSKSLSDFLLSSPPVVAFSIGSFEECRSLLLLASQSVMSFLDQSFSSRYAYASHPENVGFGDRSFFDAQSRELPFDRPSINAPSFANRLNTLAISEGLNDFPHIEDLPFSSEALTVVKIRRSHFAGPVFNLETREGYYVAQNVVVHNCRCYAKWIYNISSLPKDMLTKKGAEALAQIRRAA